FALVTYCPCVSLSLLPFFSSTDTSTTQIYTLSLHDALPISWCLLEARQRAFRACLVAGLPRAGRRATPEDPGCARLSSKAPRPGDRKSTRLNSSHVSISYAVFCLKKKTNAKNPPNFEHHAAS